MPPVVCRLSQTKQQFMNVLWSEPSLIQQLYLRVYTDYPYIPSKGDLVGAEIEVSNLADRESILKTIVGEIQGMNS